MEAMNESKDASPPKLEVSKTAGTAFNLVSTIL